MTNKKIPVPKKLATKKKRKRTNKSANMAPIVINAPNKDLVNFMKNYDHQTHDSLLEEMLDLTGTNFFGGLPGIGGDDFALSMAVHELVQREVAIIRAECSEARGEKTIESSAEATDRYIAARAKVETKIGTEKLETMLLESRKEHNDSARANLDNSDGRLYSYVVPYFNADGTHDPVGPKDVPWNGWKP